MMSLEYYLICRKSYDKLLQNLEDITKINENINKIQDEASMHYKTYYEPTLKESGEVYKAIKNFLIR